MKKTKNVKMTCMSGMDSRTSNLAGMTARFVGKQTLPYVIIRTYHLLIRDL